MHVIFIFFLTPTYSIKFEESEYFLMLSDSNPHFTIPSINATLQPVINEISVSKVIALCM